MFLAKKILAALLLPPTSPLLLAAIGLLLIRRRPRAGRALAWIGLGLLYLLSTPAITSQLLATLEVYPPLRQTDVAGAQAIVILGAGMNLAAPEYGGETVDRLALERLRYGARLARTTDLPVLLSGGAPSGELRNAEAMAEVMEADFGVPVRWLEVESLDTRDNANYSAAILRSEGITRVLLVTHAWHMARAMGEFAASGLDAVPAPTGFTDDSFLFAPSRMGVEKGYYATHEWLGILAQRLSGIPAPRPTGDKTTGETHAAFFK